MWKDYSANYIKNNRASSVSIMVAALISTLFLSFLCSVFYNSWTYEVEQIILEEGDWQGRIMGDIGEEELDVIRNFANVEKIVANEKLSREQKIAVDVYFHDMRTIFRDMPLIVDKLGLEEDAVSYHLLLLSRYLIHDPQDKEPPLLMTFYLAVLAIVSFSLVLIIRNSFAVSMRARIHQFGIFSSIGATPKQIRTCLMQEAAVLCTVPILLGSFLGIISSAGAMWAANLIAEDVVERHEAVFQYHPLIFMITISVSVLTVLFSAWMPARKLSRLTPLEAIRGTDVLSLKRKRNPQILFRLFGMEGELAGNALKAQRKALRTASLSLTLSFLGFTMMLCFFALTDISTRHTYFEKYQDVWDEMVTIKDTKIEDFYLTEKLRELEGVQDVIVYQKAASAISVSEEWQSDELSALGGLGAVAGSFVSKSNDGPWLVKAPVVIMDDEAFKEYCEQIGIASRLDGTVILNQIWDSINSNFRYKKYIPYVKENRETIILQKTEKEQGAVEIPVFAFTRQVPVLREEYDNYTLVQFIPLSLWEKISGQVEGTETDIYVRILARDGVTLAELNELEENISQLVGETYEIESENRIQEKITNNKMINGYKLILGSFCFLLALIGIANVFSNTLGFLHQRKREFAQYMSVGLTPAGMRKMFSVEALVIAGRPLLITLPLIGAFEVFATKASHLKLMEVLPEFPVVSILSFSLVIFGFIALAYYIGGKRLLQCDLSEALQNDTMA
ncbi:putative ABC transport system permease protein [Mobilisporobacter senegalensis]|uniref:Putative ABC transport system permease protein n=1 Tax=Mobilisporobacter senegalensis TaxID=1329262 RepID=A0A3N1XLA3_9FIRM|nr:ABC transporter permease [Mobilisporobacter senegalensis]ROR25842.1 putative ABC transport system permease protein [Mobilisporobacter senegalensis]